MKEINYTDDSRWIEELYFEDNITKCIECCFNRKYLERTSNCVDVRERLNIPIYLCSGEKKHYERN